MTADNLQQLVKFADNAQKMLGRITVLKERLAWLEDSSKSLIVGFDLGGTWSNSKLELSEVTLHKIRVLLVAQYQRDLAETQQLFDGISFRTEEGK